MAISAKDVKKLRDMTGAGMMDCKEALTETGGDFEKAVEYLRKKGIAKAAKKAGRETKEGIIYAYIHPGSQLGVLLEVNCETDFVARTEEFQALVKEIAMHIAAAGPRWVRPEDIPAEILDKEREIYRDQMKDQKKPPQVIEKIVEGKLKKFTQENCLLEQPYARDTTKTIRQLLEEAIARLGENIQVARFTRYALGAGD